MIPSQTRTGGELNDAISFFELRAMDVSLRMMLVAYPIPLEELRSAPAYLEAMSK